MSDTTRAVRLALDIPVRYPHDEGGPSEPDRTAPKDRAKEQVYGSTAFDSVEEILREMKMVGTVPEQEWVQFVGDSPAAEIPGVPDSATVSACWEQMDAHRVATIYADGKAHWVVTRENGDVTVEDGGLAKDNAKALAADLREEFSDDRSTELNELSVWYVLPDAGAIGRAHLLDTSDEEEARDRLEAIYEGDIEELHHQETLVSALSSVFQTGSALLAG
jgi:hypothetical protein